MKRKIIKIVLLLLFVIVLFSLTACETKKEEKENTVSTKSQVYHTYLVYNLIESDDKDLKDLNMVYAFDDKEVCTDCRMQWTFESENIAKIQYDNWVKAGNPNLKIDGSTVSFNSMAEIGKTKSEIMEQPMDNFEIYEY